MTSVPRPGMESISISPQWARTISSTMGRPRPVPCPRALVEEKLLELVRIPKDLREAGREVHHDQNSTLAAPL